MTDRRSFLTSTAIASSVLASAAREPEVASAAIADTAIKKVATEAEIVAVLRKDAKYKQVMASVPLRGGVVAHYMYNSLNGVERGYGAPAGSMHVTTVLYGTSIALVLSDAFWDAHVTDAALGVLGEKPLPNRKGNPYLHAEASAGADVGAGVEALLARGASFFVCANALMGLAQTFAKLPGFPTDAPPFDTLRRALIPQSTLVPAGVAALVTLQQQGYTYMQASIAT